MNIPSSETIQNIRKHFFILEETLEKIAEIIYPNNLIEWAEEVSLDPKASQEHLDIAVEILEFTDRFNI